MAVDRPFRHAGLLRDLWRSGLVIAVRGEELERRSHEPLAVRSAWVIGGESKRPTVACRDRLPSAARFSRIMRGCCRCACWCWARTSGIRLGMIARKTSGGKVDGPGRRPVGALDSPPMTQADLTASGSCERARALHRARLSRDTSHRSRRRRRAEGTIYRHFTTQAALLQRAVPHGGSLGGTASEGRRRPQWDRARSSPSSPAGLVTGRRTRRPSPGCSSSKATRIVGRGESQDRA